MWQLDGRDRVTLSDQARIIAHLQLTVHHGLESKLIENSIIGRC